MYDKPGMKEEYSYNRAEEVQIRIYCDNKKWDIYNANCSARRAKATAKIAVRHRGAID